MNTKTRKTAYAFALTLLCYVTARCSQPIYADVDNFQICQVLSGSFTENAICQFVNPLLSLLAHGVHLLLPNADGYLIPVYAAAALSLYCLFSEALSDEYSQTEQCVRTAMVAAIWLWAKPLNANFTMQASWLAVSGILVLHRSTSLSRQILATLFIMLGTMIRLEAVLLTVPFWGLIILADVFQQGSSVKSIIKELKKYLFACLCVLAVIAVQKCLFSIEPMKSAMIYDSFRSRVVDFPVLDFNQIPLAFDGINKADYDLATSWVFLYDDEEMLSQFREIAQEASYNMYRADSQTVHLLLLNAKYLLMAYRSALILPLIVLAASVFVMGIKRVRWYTWLQVLLGWTGGAVMILYFLHIGRIPAHVFKSILLSCMAVTALAVLEAGSVTDKAPEGKTAAITAWVPAILLLVGVSAVLLLQQKHQIVFVGGVAAIICGGVLGLTMLSGNRDFHLWAQKSAYRIMLCSIMCYMLFFLGGMKFDMPQPILDVWDEPTLAEMAGNDLYYTCRSMPWSDDTVNRGKLPSREYHEHFVGVGNWYVGQPYYQDFLKNNGFTYPAYDLLYRPDTYLLATEEWTDRIVQSLQGHYGDGVHAVQMGEFEGIAKWRIFPE